jgi:hypothetical protein
MTREELLSCLQLEMDKWASESYEALRAKLGNDEYVPCEPACKYHLEVELLENRDDYVHVGVSVCSEEAGWSCIRPLSSSFLVYRDGRVDKPLLRAESKT